MPISFTSGARVYRFKDFFLGITIISCLFSRVYYIEKIVPSGIYARLEAKGIFLRVLGTRPFVYINSEAERKFASTI